MHPNDSDKMADNTDHDWTANLNWAYIVFSGLSVQKLQHINDGLYLAHHANMPYTLDTLKPHFYIAKLGFSFFLSYPCSKI